MLATQARCIPLAPMAANLVLSYFKILYFVILVKLVKLAFCSILIYNYDSHVTHKKLLLFDLINCEFDQYDRG